MRAFTFLELLIALSLFTVGMLSILQLFPVDRRYLAQSANATQAVFLAQEGMELARSQPYGGLGIGTYEASHTLGTAPAPLSQYSRQTIITLIDGTTYAVINPQTAANDQGFKKISTTVTWVERSGSMQYSLSSFTYAP